MVLLKLQESNLVLKEAHSKTNLEKGGDLEVDKVADLEATGLIQDRGLEASHRALKRIRTISLQSTTKRQIAITLA